MIEIYDVSDDYAIKIFKLRVFIVSSLILFFLIGLYTLFIYLTNPELLRFCLIIGIVGYTISAFTGYFVINNNIKKDMNYRNKVIKATKQYIKNKRRNSKKD